MERVLLYLDDLDDAVFALAFVGERRVRWLAWLLATLLLAAAAAATVFAALYDPALGVAALSLITVLLLYRSATTPRPALTRRSRPV